MLFEEAVDAARAPIAHARRALAAKALAVERSMSAIATADRLTLPIQRVRVRIEIADHGL